MTSLPTFHLNGSAPATVRESAVEALTALRAAQQAIEACAPHKRDFYVKPDGDSAFRIAQTEHRARWRALDMIIAEIRELAEHASDAERGK